MEKSDYIYCVTSGMGSRVRFSSVCSYTFRKHYTWIRSVVCIKLNVTCFYEKIFNLYGLLLYLFIFFVVYGLWLNFCPRILICGFFSAILFDVRLFLNILNLQLIDEVFVTGLWSYNFLKRFGIPVQNIVNPLFVGCPLLTFFDIYCHNVILNILRCVGRYGSLQLSKTNRYWKWLEASCD